MMVRVFPIACILVAACMPETALGREMGPDPLKDLQYDLKEGNKDCREDNLFIEKCERKAASGSRCTEEV